MRKLFFLILGLIVSSPAFAALTSYDNTFVANDVYSSDFHSRLNANFTRSLTGGINSINSVNVVDDSMGEADMADDANPRIRTYEGASCEKVYSGLLPASSGTLTSDISAGTAYPLGYRITKTSATSKTYTASKWTFVDVDINGDFQYSEVAIGAATPSVASNSIRLARVSTDATTINAVTDLRTTSCTSGPFSAIGSSTTSGEPNLEDMLKNGAPVRLFSPAGRTPVGFAQGAVVSWDSHTTFKVTSGSLYINGEYRAASTDITVPQTADAPTQGTSGLDTGAIAGSTQYYVYGVADQDAVKPFSVSFSTSSSAPSGVTNYRFLGIIRTDANNNFVSRDIATTHNIDSRELVNGMCAFNGAATTLTCADSMNVSAAITDGGAGLYTIIWDQDYTSANYSFNCSADTDSADEPLICGPNTINPGSVAMEVIGHGGGANDGNPVSVVATGRVR